MQFPPGYVRGLNDTKISRYFPNLNKNCFEFKSLRTDDYNCVAFAAYKEGAFAMEDAFIQFRNKDGSYDERLSTYIKYFNDIGFQITENISFYENVDRICLSYAEDDIFKHVSFQVSNDKWKSKLGDWEDIEHDSPQVLLGGGYGTKMIFMERTK